MTGRRPLSPVRLMAIFTSAADADNCGSGARASRTDYLLMYEVNRRNGCPFLERSLFWRSPSCVCILFAHFYLRRVPLLSLSISPVSTRFFCNLLAALSHPRARNHFFFIILLLISHSSSAIQVNFIAFDSSVAICRPPRVPFTAQIFAAITFHVYWLIVFRRGKQTRSRGSERKTFFFF